MQRRAHGDARCYCTVIWLFCCKSLASLWSTRCHEERHQRGNLPELVLSLCHEHWSISIALLSNPGIGRPTLSPVHGFPWVQCWEKSIGASRIPSAEWGSSILVCSTGSPGEQVLPTVECSGVKGQMLTEDKWEGEKASWEGVQRSPVFMLKEMQILAWILLPVHPTRRVTHAFSPLW